MKIRLFFSLLFLTSTLFSLRVSAQSDYVITQSGDSIPCRINHPLLTTHPKYRKSPDDEPIEIKPEEIKRYYQAKKKKLYCSVFKPGWDYRQFLIVLEYGKINLYQEILTSTSYVNNQAMGASTTNWYFSKGSDTVRQLKTSGPFMLGKSRKERIADFVALIKDNKKVYDLYLAKNQFSFQDIQRLIHYYNTGELLPEETDSWNENN